jgi:hypothetical protein
MKKIDAHQWVQSLANIGVIASIIFLSVQVSQNRRSLDEANRLNAMTVSTAAMTNFNNFRTLIASDEQVANIWLKGLTGEELTPVEAVRFREVCDYLVWSDAWIFLQMPGVGRPESAAAVVDNLRAGVAKSPGLKACWDATKQLVDKYGLESFVRAVDGIKTE